MNPQKILKLTAWVGGVLLLLVVVLLISLFSFLQSGTGRGFLASKLSAYLSHKPDREVTIEGLDGHLPFDIRIQRVTVADAAGIWLEGRDILLRWAPAALLHKHFRVEQISAQSIQLDRLPTTPEEEKPRESRLPIPTELPPVTIDRLDAREVSIGRAVTGQAAVFQVEGSFLESGSGQGTAPGATVSLHVSRKDQGPQTRLDLTVTPQLEPLSIQASVEFREDSGGWLASVLHLVQAGPIQVSLAGEGPPSDWKGTLQAAVGKYGSAMGELHASEEKGVSSFFLNGSYVAGTFADQPEFAPVIGGKSRFSLTTRFGPSKVLVVEGVDFRGKGIHLSADGNLDFASQKVGGKYTLIIDDVKALTRLAGTPLEGALASQGIIAGTLSIPKITMSTKLSRFRMERISAQEVHMDTSFERMEAQGGGPGGIRLNGTGDAKELSILAGSPFKESIVKWSYSVQAPDRGDISIEFFQAEDEGHILQVKGSLNPRSISADIETVLRLKNIKAAAGSSREGTVEAAHLDIQAAGDPKTGSASGHVKGRLSKVEYLWPSYAPVLGPEFSIDGAFEIQKKSQLTISNLQLDSPGFKLDSRGSADLDRRTLGAQWELSIPKLERFTQVVQRPIAGSMEVRGTVDGAFSALKGTVDIEGKGISINGRDIGPVSSSITARDVPGAPKGSLRLALPQAAHQGLQTSSDFSLKDGQLTLSALAIRSAGAKASGGLIIDFIKPSVSGNLEGTFSETSAKVGSQGVKGEGTASFSARFTPVSEGQSVKIAIKGAGLTTAYGKIGNVAINADLTNIFKTPEGAVDVSLRDVERPNLVLNSLDFKASGGRKSVGFQGTAKGRSTEQFDLQTRGTLSLSEAAYRVELSSLGGNFGAEPFRILKPVVLEQTAGGALAVKDLAASVGAGRIEASGQTARGSVSFSGTAEKIPLGMISALTGQSFDGLADGSVRIEGNPSRPSGSFTITASRIRYPGLSSDKVRGAALALNGKLESGRLGLNFELSRQSVKMATGSLAVPVSFSLAPFGFSVPPQGALEGRMEGQADIAFLTDIFPLEGRKLTGNLTGAFTLSGTMAHPATSGNMTIADGSYEDFISGTVLKNISADATASGRKLVITKLTATDGAKGTVSATGWMDIDAASHFPLQIDVSASSAKLIQRENLNASVSGEVRLAGSLQTMTFTGSLDVSSAEYDIPKRSRPAIAKLKVTEIYAPGEKSPGGSLETERASRARAASSPFSLKLDLALKIPEKAAVRGRGLNSEWKGSVRLGGTASALTLTGQLSLQRGYYEFLGRRFTLKAGTIQFYGSSPPEPVVDITAEAKTKDITARLNLSGPVSSPQIKLESEPSLPQDEILARVLFNRDLTQVTPVEAVRIASALSALSGKGNAFDFVEHTREFLKLDQLGVTEASEGKNGKKGYSLEVGKYLTDDIYVDVEKGVDGASGRVSVQVEVTPHLSVESKVGTNTSGGSGSGTGNGSGSGVEIDWKRDY